MTDNQMYLDQALAKIRNSETGQKPEQLWYADDALRQIHLDAESGSQRTGMRDRVFLVWLQLLAILDGSIDPNVNSKTVVPEVPLPQGVNPGIMFLTEGARIYAITDLQARAAYKRALQEHGEREIYLYVQRNLRYYRGRILPDVEAFIQSSYTSSAEDQRALKDAIDGEIKNPQRKAQLYKYVVQPAQCAAVTPKPQPQQWIKAYPDQLCPQSGEWFSPFLKKTFYIKQGEPMPGPETTVQGGVIWYLRIK